MRDTVTGADSVVHVYGVVDPRARLLLPERGIGGVAITLETDDDLGVLVSELPAERYGVEEWQLHSDDPRWLGDIAQEHHQVLQRVMEQTDVLPLRLPGIHRDLESLKHAMAAEKDLLVRALGRVREKFEIGVKVFQGPATPKPEEEHSPRSGRDYLMRRAAKGKEKEEARRQLHEAVVSLHGRLADEAVEATTNPPQDPVLSGREEPMLLNAAYLVEREAEDSFFTLVEQVAREYASAGVHVEPSGPWPPYNFSALAETEHHRSPR
jgi:gas vesicle protein GvpL/GvpF